MKKTVGISLLCCYNDMAEARHMLLDSIDSIMRDLPFKLDVHMIDTKAKGYKSAAEAYNKEVALHRDDLKDILVFCHQDISFPDSRLLCRIYDDLTFEPSQILGVAGMPSDGSPVSNLKYKSDDGYITRRQLSEKTAMVTLDECLIAMHKDVFMSMKFDENILKHWHLYAVDICYNARLNHGIESYVLPEMTYHKYSADKGQATDNTFLCEINNLATKYKNKVDVIRTPCYILPTSFIPRWRQLLRTMAKNLIGR